MKIKYLLAASVVSLSATAMLPSAASAQSTGSVDFEGDVIVVSGARSTDVQGVSIPDTPKARQVLNQDIIERQNPGQSILDTINLVPGVTFTNNDAYGSAGGQLSIRGFSEDRISLTFDGIPLNDSGNYAIYSNQQLDPELIEQVNVSLGSTDVDSPTAAATGSTVNYRTRNPYEEFGVRLSGSAGEFDFFRIFGSVDTGEFTPFGTRAFLAASTASNRNPFNNYGRVNKQQYNGRVYQPIGSNGDFIAISGHYNQNRNNFFGSVPLRYDLTNPLGFPQETDEREYNINFPCLISQASGPGRQTANTCGTEFDRRYNPSNTGNIRGQSRFTLADGVVFTVDPSFQYVKANGGGTVLAEEGTLAISGQQFTGYINGRPYFGMDLNGDGDMLDQIVTLAPSNTRTRRYGVIAGLRWDINDDHTVRIAYTWDRARHRQTGEVGFLKINGEPLDVFTNNDPLSDATGTVLQKRDRLSFAILNQVAGEYRGNFGDLTVLAGIRAPFFKRDLNNYCFTTSVTGFVDCFGGDATRNNAYAALRPTVQGPQQRVLKYDEILPNVGLVYSVSGNMSVFANYSKGLQVPGTDALYNAFFFPADTPSARPEPEMSDNVDAGFRWRAGNLQAQLSGWYTRYTDRLATAYDPETDRNLYRNLGVVEKYGVDGSVSWQPIREMAFYFFGSYMKSEIKEDVQFGSCTTAQVTAGTAGCTTVGQPIFVQTAGKREAGAPKYSYGASARGFAGPVEVGVTAKRTGGKYIYDTNLPIFGGTAAAPTELFPAQTPAYWLVNLDASIDLGAIGMDKSSLQLNVYNLFDSVYVGRYNTALNQNNVLGQGVFLANPSGVPFAQIGAPRTISGTVTFRY